MNCARCIAVSVTFLFWGCAPLPRDGVDGRALAAGVHHELGTETAEKCPKGKVYDNIRGCTTWKELLGR